MANVTSQPPASQTFGRRPRKTHYFPSPRCGAWNRTSRILASASYPMAAITDDWTGSVCTPIRKLPEWIQLGLRRHSPNSVSSGTAVTLSNSSRYPSGSESDVTHMPLPTNGREAWSPRAMNAR